MADPAAYDDAMSSAERAYDLGEWSRAYTAFAKAHELGHAVRSRHLAAHRGMIRAASHGGRADRVLKNELLLAAAFLFDRSK